MNHGDRYTSSSYRKIFGDSPRFSFSSSRTSSASARGSPGFRSMAAPRNSMSSMSAYRRIGRSSTPFSLVPSDSLDLTQTSVVNSEFKVIRTNEKEQLQVGMTVRKKSWVTTKILSSNIFGWLLYDGLFSVFKNSAFDFL